MKKTISLSLLTVLCLFAMTSANAQENSGPGTSGYKTSLGVRLSSSSAMVNNSVSIKHFINDKMAIEGLFSFGDPLALGAMVELHKPLASEGLSWFYGGGGYVSFVKKVNTTTLKTTTDPNFGAMGVVGLDYKFANIPLNISLDWKPELNIVSDINFEPAAIGFTARFTFGK